MRIALIGYNSGVLAALDNFSPGGVVVVEEPDLWEGKKLAVKASAQRSVEAVQLARYQQDDHFLEVLDGLGPVDAVAPGLEYAVTAAARAAEALSLPGAGAGAAALLRDKLSLREATRAAGMSTPEFREVASAADVAAFGSGRPCVVKPANRQASLGVVLLDADDDAEAAWREATEADEGVQVANRPMRWRYLAEERLYGPEYSTECLVGEGRLLFLNVTEKRTLAGNRPVEVGHVVGEADDGTWRHHAEQLVAAVGFGTGILHAEWVLTTEGPVLIECAGRPPGDRIVDLIDLAYDINLTAAWMQVMAGARPDVPVTPRQSAAIRFVATAGEGGVLDEVSGTEEARSCPGVVRVDVLRQPGDPVGPLRSSWDRVASVIAVGDTPGEAERRAEGGAARLHICLR